MKVIEGKTITDADLMDELNDVCEREHYSCNSECPVYMFRVCSMGNDFNCECFKNGRAMLDFIRDSIKQRSNQI